jgi:outer membrane protein assembly factor BamB
VTLATACAAKPGWVRALAVAATLTALPSCTIFPPVERPEPRRLSLDWATRLYELEPLAYHPVDTTEPLFVQSDATPEGGLVVVPGKDRKVRGLDAVSGRTIWEATTLGPNGSRPLDLAPHGFPGELLVASMDGRVHRLSQRNGKQIWLSQAPATAAITSSPAVAGTGDAAKVFVTSLDNRLTALSLGSGEKLWDYERVFDAELTITGQAGAAVGKDMVLTGFSDGALVALSQADGAVVWTTDLKGNEKQFVDVDTTPLIVPIEDGHVVVAGSFARGLFGVGLDDGVVLWNKVGEGFARSIALDGIVYASRTDGHLFAIEAASGKTLWGSRFDTGWAGAPAVSRKYVVLPIGEGLTLVDRSSGRQLLRWDDGRGVRGAPEVAHGSIYLVGNSGQAYGLGLY